MSHRTYRTRIEVADSAEPALDAYAELFSRVGRTLHARLEAQRRATGKPGNTRDFKNAALVEFGLTGRQFNAIQVSLDGQRSAVEECRNLHIDTLRDRIERLTQALRELKESLAKGRLNKDWTSRRPLTQKQQRHVLFTIHHKSRRLNDQRRRLEALLAQQRRNEVSLCFGSRGLFHQQFNLNENGYRSHAQWRADWQAARDGQFLVLGSKGETAGCQGCVATINEDSSLSLRLRLPDALTAEHGKYVELGKVRFAYGHDQILAALKGSEARRVNALQAQVEAKRSNLKFSEKGLSGGAALTYRFLRDAKSWEVLVSVDVKQPPVRSIAAAGRVAVDVNADHLAVAETDCHGNCVRRSRCRATRKACAPSKRPLPSAMPSRK